MSATVVVLLLCVPLVLDLLRAPCYYSVLSLGKLASGHSPGTRRRVPGECSQPIRRRVMQLVQRDVEEEAPPHCGSSTLLARCQNIRLRCRATTMPQHCSPSLPSSILHYRNASCEAATSCRSLDSLEAIGPLRGAH